MEIKLIASGSRPWELWTKNWGLSFIINNNILFDTFANYRTLAKRARRANVDLDKIDAVVISHDHWDHIGGLWTLLEQRRGLQVYVPQHTRSDIKAKIRSLGGCIIDEQGTKTIQPDVYVTDEIIGKFGKTIIAEQSVVLKTSKGLVLIVGCSHPGIVTIVQKAKLAFKAPVFGVIGGLHLMNVASSDIQNCALTLQKEGICFMAPVHCTGWRAERSFKKIFGKNFVSMSEGQVILF